jgi:hypothetical protein
MHVSEMRYARIKELLNIVLSGIHHNKLGLQNI